MAEYIEREATIELLRSIGSRDYRREKGTIQEAIKMVSFSEYTPAADVAPVRHSSWKRCGSVLCECQNCGEIYSLSDNLSKGWNYCPNCGARMDLTEGDANDT